jgi:hypothetical protein
MENDNKWRQKKWFLFPTNTWMQKAVVSELDPQPRFGNWHYVPVQNHQFYNECSVHFEG